MELPVKRNGYTKARIGLLYRTIVVAIVTSILVTPLAISVSYVYSKARYERIIDRQIADFSNILFSNITPATSREIYQYIIQNYLESKNALKYGDAHLSYIALTDEFDQEIAQNDLIKKGDRVFNRQSIKSCIDSYVPIISYDGDRYFCARTSIVSGHRHYNVYGLLLVSDGVIADFINNALAICALTSFAVIMVSIFQYYVSIKIGRTLIKANVKTLLLLGNTIALRDNDTFHHNLRVMIYSYYFGAIIDLPDHAINELISGALLHDIGKIGIPDAVLQKPGRLTAEEFEIIKGHVTLGEQIMINSNWTDAGIDVIKFHHEKFDGTGYPNQCKGLAIPLIARIFAIVDVFDAISSARPYKEARSYESTMASILSSRGQHFDPDLVDRFIDISRMLYDKYANRNDDEIVNEANRILNVYYG